MNKKLTLNIDGDIIDFAHQYALETGQSVSAIVENYFSALQNQQPQSSLTKDTVQLYGILQQNPLPDKNEQKA